MHPGRNLFVAPFVLALGCAAAGATIHVPADVPSIAAAVALAAEDDVIELAPGTYVGEGNRDVVVSVGGITILGSGSGSTVIDCQGDPRSPHRAFDVTAPSFTLAGVTIRNGFVVGAGAGLRAGIQSQRGELFGEYTVTDCAFEQCTASSGEGTYGSGAALAITFATDVTIQGCSFRDNTADSAAVACQQCGSITVERSIFDANVGTSGAGGLSASALWSLSLQRCEFGHNTGWYAGAIYSYSDYHSWFNVRNCLFHDNVGSVLPVGVFGGAQFCEIDYCTFVNNVTDDPELFYEAIQVDHGYVRGCILWDGYSSGGLTLACCIKDGWEGNGSTLADPLFVDPAHEDYHLRTDSPLLDYGYTPARFGGDVDLDGNTREVDAPWVTNGPYDLNDLGCYELQLPVPSPDIDHDGSVNAADVALLLGAWGSCSACGADLDLDGTVGPADLAILLGAWS
ncbi:MAG: right-handed parallel beta-helix repeat-containing protein [Phycisphaerales bacterium]